MLLLYYWEKGLLAVAQKSHCVALSRKLLTDTNLKVLDNKLSVEWWKFLCFFLEKRNFRMMIVCHFAKVHTFERHQHHLRNCLESGPSSNCFDDSYLVC